MMNLTQLRAPPVQWLDDDSDHEEEHNYDYIPRCNAPVPRAPIKFSFSAVMKVNNVAAQPDAYQEADFLQENVQFICTQEIHREHTASSSNDLSIELTCEDDSDSNRENEDSDAGSDYESEGQHSEADQ